MKHHPLMATFGLTMRAARFLLLSVVLITMLGTPAYSQGTVGSILGDVTDATGARLPGATVRLVNEGTGATREALTSEVGSYRFNGLQPVIYTVTVEFPGFTTVTRPGVKVNAASDTKIDFALDVSATVETITVTEQAPLVETTENTIKTLIDTTKIRELPLKSRDFMDLALLSPGVVTDQASDARGTLTDSVSFGGMGERFKSMWLEGVDINDEVTGGGSSISSATRTQLAQEAVQEFQVMANSYSSEFGRSATGVINIVTKSGTNQFHGNAFYFRRDDAFDKPNAFTGVAPPFKSEQYGGTIGGPIVEDKAHFFVSYERRSADQVAFVVIPPQLVSFVDSIGYDTTADVPNPWRFHNLFTKGSVTISPEHTLNIVGVYDNRLIENTTAGGNLSFDSGYEDDRNSHFITVSLSSLFGSSIVNELRVNRSDQELFRDSIKNRPSLRFPSIRFGRDNTQGRRQQNWILSNTMTYNVGNHTIKFGGEANRVLGTYVSSANTPGTYEFRSDLPVDPNDPSTLPFRFTQGLELRKGSIDVRGFDTAAYTRNSNIFAVFLNDSWRMRPNLTVNAGIRYDLQLWRGDIDGTPFPEGMSEFDLWKSHLNGELRGHPFAPVPDDKNNFSPRVGLSWDPQNNGRAVIRAGYGVFYDSLWTSSVRGVVQNYAGYRQTNLGNDVRSSGVPNDFFPGYPGGRSFGDPPDRSILTERAASRVRLPSRTTSNPFMHQFSGGLDLEVAQGTMVGFNFIHMFGQDLGFNRNVNACITNCVLQSGQSRADFPKIYPLDQSGIRMELALDQSNITKANQFQVRMEKRFLSGRALSMNYTLGDIKEFASSPSNHHNLRQDWGPTRNDIRHRFIGNYSHELPYGIRLAVVAQFTSAPPYNITTGNDDNGDGQRRDRPAGVEYNSGRGDRLSIVDLRTSKIFNFGESQSVEVMWEMFNVFNTDNFVQYNGNMRSSRFGQPSLARDPFQGQFGLRYTF